MKSYLLILILVLSAGAQAQEKVDPNLPDSPSPQVLAPKSATEAFDPAQLSKLFRDLGKLTPAEKMGMHIETFDSAKTGSFLFPCECLNGNHASFDMQLPGSLNDFIQHAMRIKESLTEIKISKGGKTRLLIDPQGLKSFSVQFVRKDK